MSIDIQALISEVAAQLQSFPMLKKFPSVDEPSVAFLKATDLADSFVFDDVDQNSALLNEFCEEYPNDIGVYVVYVKYLFNSGQPALQHALNLFRKVVANGCDVRFWTFAMIYLAKSLNKVCTTRSTPYLISLFASKVIRCFKKTNENSYLFHYLLILGGLLAERTNCESLAIGFYKMAWKIVLTAKEDYSFLPKDQKKSSDAEELMKIHTSAAYLIIFQCKTISSADFVMLNPFETLGYFILNQEFRCNDLIVAIDICLCRQLVDPTPYYKEYDWRTLVQSAVQNQVMLPTSDCHETFNFCIVCNMVATQQIEGIFFCCQHFENRDRRRFH